jgi:hypothetical protein
MISFVLLLFNTKNATKGTSFGGIFLFIFVFYSLNYQLPTANRKTAHFSLPTANWKTANWKTADCKTAN